MNIETLLEEVYLELPQARYEHTLRVRDTAIEIAKQLENKQSGIMEDKILLAAILHDYCKFWSDEQLTNWIKKHGLPSDLLDYHSALWHAPVGAEVAAKHFGIKDEEVLDAIRYHTTGRPQMSTLEKIIFLADLIEPGRRFPGVEALRKCVANDLDQAMLQALDQTIGFLIEKKQKIYPLTLLARNFYLDVTSNKM